MSRGNGDKYARLFRAARVPRTFRTSEKPLPFRNSFYRAFSRMTRAFAQAKTKLFGGQTPATQGVLHSFHRVFHRLWPRWGKIYITFQIRKIAAANASLFPTRRLIFALKRIFLSTPLFFDLFKNTTEGLTPAFSCGILTKV